MNKNIRISKINSKYVNNDCLQIKIPFFNTMTLFDNSKILFHAKDLNNIDINTYLLDERKKLFNDNTPIKYIKKFFKHKILFVNQIFDFNKPYTLIRSGIIQQYYFSRVNNDNLIIQKTLEQKKRYKIIINHQNLQAFFTKITNYIQCDNVHVIDINGNFLKSTSDIECNKPIFIIKNNNIRVIKLNAKNKDNKFITVYDIPTNDYTLKQIIKFMKHTIKPNKISNQKKLFKNKI